MAQDYNFSLLLANQYEGGPLLWDENVLINTAGAIVNKIDVTQDSTQAFKVGESEIISVALSVSSFKMSFLF